MAAPIAEARSPTDRARAQAVVDAYRTCPSEEDGPLALIEGALPEGLRGTLYRNGIVGLDVHGTQQMHPFDGDGMVSRFSFDGRGVQYRNRIVETREVREERAAGRMLYRAFGTNLPGGFLKNALRMRFKNAANTSVVHHGGRLLALWEGGQPHALDPDSLTCLGRFDFGGQLRSPAGGIDAMITPELPFSAHPTIDPADGSLHNFGTLIGRRAELVLYRVDPGGRMVERRFVPLPRASFVHDFVLTPHYRVFFLTPVTFDVARALSGLTSPVDSISRDPSEPTEVLLVPRDGSEPIRIEAEPSFTFHWINGFETEDGRVVIDGCRMADFEGGTLDLRDVDVVQHLEVPPPVPTRWVLDVERRTATERTLSDTHLELPGVHPAFRTRPYRYGYGIARLRPSGPPIHSGLGRLDVESGEMLTRDFDPDLPGEPIVVPKPGRGDELGAWILSVIYVAREHRSELLVLDAEDLSTVARLALPHHHPPGFHGQFVPAP